MLKVKKVAIRTHGEHIAFLSAHGAAYKPEVFKSLYKVVISVRGTASSVTATVNTVEDKGLLAPDEVGLAANTFEKLGVPEGTYIDLTLTSPPPSLDHVRRKIAGETLNAQEISGIVRDITAERYSKTEIAAFVVACAAFMTTDEVLSLTKAMAAVGAQLRWDTAPTHFPMVLDKHCVGGLPGNRTSMIVVPIVAAYGLPIPKTSSRAITSPSGTADTMEVLANVDVPENRMRAIVAAERGCLAWGGHVNLSPADDILISVERPLAIDTPEQLVASIISKKLAAGSTHLLVDIPVGPSAKVRSQAAAARLKKLFEHVGTAVGLEVSVILTDGTQPVGRGIGPVLEARDVMAVLRNAPDAPRDLRDRALMLASRLLDFDPSLRGGRGLQAATQILESGAALASMERIMAAQGPPPETVSLGDLTHELRAPRAGTVTAIDSLRLARIARLAGAPLSKGSGLDLLKKVGDSVQAGEPMYRLHATFETELDFAREAATADSAYTVN
jgi:thymidine phosphorylase